MYQKLQELDQWNQQGRYAEVVSETNTLITTPLDQTTDDDFSQIYTLRGNAQFGLGRFQESVKTYQKAIEYDTSNVQARCNYGASLYSLGQYVDALNACDAAILADDTFAPSYVNAAHCLVALNHSDEAIYALEQAYRLDSDNISLGLTVSEMASDIGDFELALSTYLNLAKNQNAPATIHQSIFALFQKFKGTLEYAIWQNGLNQWRNQFATSPEVLKLSGELLRG